MRLWYPTTVATRGFYIKEKILEAAGRVGRRSARRRSTTSSTASASRGGSSLETVADRRVRAPHQLPGLRHGGGACASPATTTATAMAAVQHPGGGALDGDVVGSRARGGLLRALRRAVLLAARTRGQEVPDRRLRVGHLRLLQRRREHLVRATLARWCVVGRHARHPPRLGQARRRWTCRALDILERKLGTRKNTKGFKVLPSYFGVIQGDGVNDEIDPRDLHELRRTGTRPRTSASGWAAAGCRT